MKNLKRLFSLFTVVCLCITLFPASIAFAEDAFEDTDYVTRADVLPENFAGHVITYNIDSEKGANVIRLDVGFRNTVGKATTWTSRIDFDSTTLVPYDLTANAAAEDELAWGNAFELGKVVEGMTSEDKKNYVGRPIKTYFINDPAVGYFEPYEDREGVGKILYGIPIKTSVNATMASAFPGLSIPANGLGYEPPKNVTVHLYSVYFTLADGKTMDDVKYDTIRMAKGGAEAPHGSSIDGGEGNLSAYTCMVGFPAIPYSVNFAITSEGNAVEGAAITMKDTADSSKTYSGKTDAEGKLTLEVPNGSYQYEVSKVEFQTISKTMSVNGSDIDVSEAMEKQLVPMEEAAIKFVDKETGDALKDVTMSVFKQTDDMATASATASYISGEDGTVTVSLPEGNYKYKAVKDGYKDVTESTAFVLPAAEQKLPDCQMTLKEYDVVFTITEPDGESGTKPLVGADIVVSPKARLSSTKTAKTDENGQATVSLQAGEYSYTVSKNKYETQSADITVSAGVNQPVSVSVPKKELSAEPKYTVNGTYDETAETMTVAVELANINATGGTFGLKYDSEILTLADTDGIVYQSTDKIKLDDTNGNGAQNQDGYLTFSWAEKTEGAGIDASTAALPLVTYKFNLSKDNYDKLVDSETLTVMPWKETALGQANLGGVNLGIWVDATPEDEGAIGGGFYLAKIHEADGAFADDDSDITKMLYEFTYPHMDRYRMSYYVTNQSTKAPIEGAAIVIYSKAEGASDTPVTLTTNAEGYAKVILDPGEYQYKVSATNYWPNPEEGYTDFSVLSEGIRFDVELEPKELHDVKATATNGYFVIGDKSGASLELEKAAARREDFYFYALPDAGYVKDQLPKYKIGETGEEKTAVFDAATNRYKVPGAEITDTIILTASFVEGTYTIRANSGSGGHLKYDTQENLSSHEVTLTSGANSEDFVFAVDDPATTVIYQVIINGEVYPIAENLTEFTYKFEDVRFDQTISVVYSIDGTISEYVVSVITGEYGNTAVTTSAGTENVEGGKRKDFILNKDDDLTAVITPIDAESPLDTDFYVIDTVYINDELQAVANNRTHTVTISGNDEVKRNLVSTFKSKESEESFQYWIRTHIIGDGTVNPAGGRLYYPAEKPSFTFSPAENWQVESVVLRTLSDVADEDGSFISDTEVKDDVADNVYTFKSLTKDTLMIVTFDEIKSTITGSVQFFRGEKAANAVQEPVITTPSVVFVRQSDKKEFAINFSSIVPEPVSGSNGMVSMGFSIGLPTGTYKATASKRKHISYTITDFDLTVNAENPSATDTEIKPMVLTPGNTDTDDFITFFDVLRVSDGTGRYGTGRADINEDGIVTIDDMTHSKGNYGKGDIQVKFADHQNPAPAGE